DRILHEVAGRLIHHPVTRDDRLSGEAGRDDGEPPVRAAAIAIPRVAAVVFTFVSELELERLERLQPVPDFGGEGHSSCLYFASTSDWPMTNRNINPMPSKRLTVAQSIGSTFFLRASSQPTWTMLAAMATAVATKISQTWMATKKSATGKRSYRNFIQGRHSTRLWLRPIPWRTHGAGQADRIPGCP